MKNLANLARILVGIEFVFSGFTKIVDPYGTGLKFQEYFEVFAQALPSLSGFFEFLAHHSQTLSLVFCASELILGVALLFSYKMNITAWIALLLMCFFTFLTFYSAYYEKVTDCGCFGDFLKLKPWHSFFKDLVSLVLIIIIFVYRKNYLPNKFGREATIAATFIAFGIGFYALRYLPPVDFLPYAVDKSIPEQMKPTGIKPLMEYTFLDKTTNEKVVSLEYLADTTKYKYESVVVLNQDEVTPKITDFSISDIDGNEVTDQILEGKDLVIIIKKLSDLDENDIREIESFNDFGNSGINPVILTSISLEDFEKFAKQNSIKIPFYAGDEKVLKTMARVDPTYIALKDGTILGKWSVHNIPNNTELTEIINK